MSREHKTIENRNFEMIKNRDFLRKLRLQALNSPTLGGEYSSHMIHLLAGTHFLSLNIGIEKVRRRGFGLYELR